jgi:hypothetical protein
VVTCTTWLTCHTVCRRSLLQREGLYSSSQTRYTLSEHELQGIAVLCMCAVSRPFTHAVELKGPFEMGSQGMPFCRAPLSTVLSLLQQVHKVLRYE